MTTTNQLVAHAIGDYILQSDWMANEKTKSNIAATSHAIAYTLPFLLFRPSAKQVALITGTHFFIDRFRLARYVCWAKNWIAPLGQDHEMTATGYPSVRPAWMAVWLLIIADNTMHVVINGLVLRSKKL